MQPGLTLFRVSTPTEPVYGVSESSFCVIAQGAKHVMLGEDRFRYDPNRYLISTVGLPTISQIDVASSGAGDDILRSKSFDKNSYNSDHWFNKLAWTYQTNNFAVGRPQPRDNQH